MATAMMLKTKPNSKLPIHFLRNPISSLTRPVTPIPQPEITIEAPQLSLSKASAFPLLGMTQKLFAGESGLAAVRNGGFALPDGAVFVRQMSTSRNEDVDDVDEEEEDFDDHEDDEDFDDDEDDDDFDEYEGPVDVSEDDEEEEKPKQTKRW